MGMCHTYVNSKGLGAAVVVDSEYNSRVAFALIAEATRLFQAHFDGTWEALSADTALQCDAVKQVFTKFQNPVEADKLLKIEKDLGEVKETVLQSLDDLMQRGEKLETLIDKTKDLSAASKKFRREAEKNNSWCEFL